MHIAQLLGWQQFPTQKHNHNPSLPGKRPAAERTIYFTLPSSGGCDEKWRTVSNHLNAHFALLYPAVLQFLLLVMRIGKDQRVRECSLNWTCCDQQEEEESEGKMKSFFIWSPTVQSSGRRAMARFVQQQRRQQECCTASRTNTTCSRSSRSST